MLIEDPSWTFTSQKLPDPWDQHVHLLPDHVVGQWFCLCRASGKLLWQRTMFRPNEVCGIDSGVIVATELRSDGPSTDPFGCYGISLNNGRLLWTAHRTGIWGDLVRLLDFIPAFTNELRDSPHHVLDGKVFCASGRILDVRTGRLLETVSPETVWSYQEPQTLALQLYLSRSENKHTKVPIGDGLVLYHTESNPGFEQEVWGLAAETEDGKPVWQWSINEFDCHIDGGFGSYRLVLPYLYLVVSEEPCYRWHSTKPHCIEPNPTLWHVMTLDVRDGSIVQEFPLRNEKLEVCRIEDADERGVLIGESHRQLFYFERRS